MSKFNDGIPPHVLHIHPDRDAAELIGQYGRKLRHTIVSDDDLVMQAMPRGLTLKRASHFPKLKGMPSPGRLQKIARAMTPFDLVLSHGWDAMNAAMAHTLFKDAMQLPPLIHHEASLGDAEEKRLSKRRTWYRRIALGKSSGLVVPSERLEEVALVDWQQPLGRVKRIAPGVDTKLFAKQPKPDGFRVIKRAGEFWLGTHVDNADAQDLPMLVRAFSVLNPAWHLIVVGDSTGRSESEKAIEALELDDRVHWVGPTAQPEKLLGLFDIFAQAQDAGGFPLVGVQAMAAGVALIVSDEGELAHTVAEANHPWLFQKGDETALGKKLAGLAKENDARRAAGEANRAHAVARYDREKTIATYRRLYGSAMKIEL